MLIFLSHIKQSFLHINIAFKLLKLQKTMHATGIIEMGQPVFMEARSTGCLHWGIT